MKKNIQRKIFTASQILGDSSETADEDFSPTSSEITDRERVRMLWLILQDSSTSLTGLIFLKMRTKFFRFNLACHKCQSSSLFHNFIHLPG